jgi:hypothetical protein
VTGRLGLAREGEAALCLATGGAASIRACGSRGSRGTRARGQEAGRRKENEEERRRREKKKRRKRKREREEEKEEREEKERERLSAGFAATVDHARR